MDLKILILQILNEQDALSIIETQEKISVMDLLFKGGFMMIPIFLLFIIILNNAIFISCGQNKLSKSKMIINFNNMI